MQDGLWFGTREYMQYIPCPQINGDHSGVGWSTSAQYLNGGAFERNSATSHREFEMSWSLAKRVDLQPLYDYAAGIYGSGPLYFIDPFAADLNVLPEWWAAPGMAALDAPVLVGEERPAPVNNPNQSLGYPTRGVTYAVRTSPPVVRTNLVTNPAARVNTSGWTTTGGALSRVTGSSVLGLGAHLKLTASGSGQLASISFNSTVGATYRLSVYVKNPSVVARLDFRNASNAVRGSSANVTRADWTRVDVSATADSATSSLVLRSEGAGEIEFVAALVELGSTLGGYFDGDTTDTDFFSYSWTGTANASTSTKTPVAAETPQKLWLPIPPGKTLWIGAHGAPNDGAYVRVTPFTGPGTSGTPVDLVNEPVTSNTRVTDSFSSASGYVGVEVSLEGYGSLNLVGVIAQILDNGIAPQPGGFIGGMGHSGCTFRGKPTKLAYSSAMDFIGSSATLVETEGWE